MSALARLRAVPMAYWFALAAAGCLVFVVVHDYCRDDEDRSWLDPHQPGVNLDPIRGAVLDVTARVTPPALRRAKPYPDSLHAWDGTWVGDC